MKYEIFTRENNFFDFKNKVSLDRFFFFDDFLFID